MTVLLCVGVATDDAYQSAVEVPFINAAGDLRQVAHPGPPLLHALARGETSVPLCGQREPLLPTFIRWAQAPRGVRNCAACLGVAPLSIRPGSRRQDGAVRPYLWRYRDALNRFDISEGGVDFLLPAFGFFRPRHLRWEDVDAFAPQRFRQSEAGFGDKGGGAKWGSPLAWRLSLRRPDRRSVGLPRLLTDRYSEERIAAWATAMNDALALPR